MERLNNRLSPDGMNNNNEALLAQQAGILKMSEKEFSLFSSLIYGRLGIKMPPAKKVMLTSRLSKRAKVMGCSSYREYYDLIMTDSAGNDEFNRMIEAVTTNKTDFFREPEHFRVMTDRVLPELVSGEKFIKTGCLCVWSAGSSTGAEAYTIAMVMSEFFSGRGGDFSILATDISQRVLRVGMDAVYTEQEIDPVPHAMRKRFLLRGTRANEGFFKIAPELRNQVEFRQLNLMDSEYRLGREMDIIFCRNVIIYFDRDTQAELFRKMYDLMVPGGYLFIGSSETLFSLNNRFIPAGPTIYRKPGG